MGALLALAKAQDAGHPAVISGDQLKSVIDAGHAWLQRHQDDDGRWSAAMFLVHDAKGEVSNGWGKPDQDVFVTALVVNACFGIGQLPNDAKSHPHVCRAIEWLASQVQEDGSIGWPASRTLVRDTAAAGQVLASAQRYHKNGKLPDLTQVTTRLNGWLLPNGLWPRCPTDTDADPVTTVMAIHYLTELNQAPGAERLDILTALDRPADPFTAHAGAAFLAQWYLRSPERCDACCTLLGKKLPAAGLPPAKVDYLAWFWTAQAMQFRPADQWEPWWQALAATGIALQRKEGALRGSWDPLDVRGREGGRVYATAAMLLALEVVWRKQFRDR